MKVSVIIPVYNVERYLTDCLDSVRNQTLKDIEIICVHDAGTDGSLAILKRTAEADPRIRIIENEKNLGLAETRNVGLRAAAGEYVYYLDSDDMLQEDALKILSERSDREALDLSVFGAQFVYENEAFKAKFGRDPAVFKKDYPDVMHGRDLYVSWMESWDWMPAQPHYFYRRSFLLKNALWFVAGMLHEDETYAMDAVLCASRIRVTNELFYIRRFRADSIMTGRITMRNVDSCIRILRHSAAVIRAHADDARLCAAVRFYMTKIAANARGKYAAVLKAGDADAVPRVSVLIPVYNTEPWLRACLNSVLDQTERNIEIICVNDASTDGSFAVLKEYEEIDPRIRVLQHDRNKGQSAGRNLAAENAYGKYIYMLDADDLIVPEAMKTLSDLADSTGADVIGFENRQFTDDPAFQTEAEKVLFTYQKVKGSYTGPEAFSVCVKEDVISPSVPTFFMKRSYIEKRGLRFMEGILHEDIGYIFEMLVFAEKVLLTDKAYFLRRFRAHSTVTSRMSARNMEGYLKSFLRAGELLPELKGPAYENAAFLSAFRKWQRDVFGRIRMLYMTAEDSIYYENGNSSDPAVCTAFTLLKLSATGKARAEDILGPQLLKELGSAVYLYGEGQYLHRMIDAVGAVDTEIRGILQPQPLGKTLRGFRILTPEEADRTLPVLIAASHYNEEAAAERVREAGFQTILKGHF